MVRLPSGSIPGRVLASSAEIADQMADWFATGDVDRPAEALGVFTQAGGERIDAWSFHGEEVLLDHGCPDGANIGVATQALR